MVEQPLIISSIRRPIYDKSTELPDYDFFSPDPLNDAKKLADIYKIRLHRSRSKIGYACWNL